MKKLLTLIIVLVVSVVGNLAKAQDVFKGIATVAVNVRAEASNTGNVLGTIPQGHELEVTSIENGWAKINYFGQSGYVLAEYIRPASNNEGSSTGQGLGESLQSSASNSFATTQEKLEAAKIFIKDFTNIAATWTCGFDSFDKGYYGVRVESFDENGTMFTMALKGSWGVTDPGFYQWRVGSGKGWSMTDWFAVAIPVSFEMGDYLKGIEYKNNKVKYEKGLLYGLLASPGVRLKAGSLVIGAQIELGFAYTDKVRFEKGLEFSLGFKY